MSVLSALVMLLIMGTLHCTTGDECPNKFVEGCIVPCLVATYDDIVNLPNHPEVLLIDVRKPEELACTGSIPASINIPLSVVGEELKLSSKAFKGKYGRKKPDQNDPITFSCRSGNRAAEAANTADQLGFTKYSAKKLTHQDSSLLEQYCHLPLEFNEADEIDGGEKHVFPLQPALTNIIISNNNNAAGRSQQQ